MSILAIIPARMASSRFPGKPMIKIVGKPMIGHVYERVSKSKILDKMNVKTAAGVAIYAIKNNLFTIEK